MGLYPKPFTDVMHVSVTELLQARGRVQAELTARHQHDESMTAMNWPVVYPEIWLLVMACVVLLVDLLVTDRAAPPHLLADAGQHRRVRRRCTWPATTAAPPPTA